MSFFIICDLYHCNIACSSERFSRLSKEDKKADRLFQDNLLWCGKQDLNLHERIAH